eukprot:gi/632962703/ref/XP_007897468.1/ PREDICTED: triadin-like [Callorhinchus milii]
MEQKRTKKEPQEKREEKVHPAKELVKPSKEKEAKIEKEVKRTASATPDKQAKPMKAKLAKLETGPIKTVAKRVTEAKSTPAPSIQAPKPKAITTTKPEAATKSHKAPLPVAKPTAETGVTRNKDLYPKRDVLLAQYLPMKRQWSGGHLKTLDIAVRAPEQRVEAKGEGKAHHREPTVALEPAKVKPGKETKKEVELSATEKKPKAPLRFFQCVFLDANNGYGPLANFLSTQQSPAVNGHDLRQNKEAGQSEKKKIRSPGH